MKLLDDLSILITEDNQIDEKTKIGRIAVIEGFVRYLWQSNIRIRVVDDIRAQHIQNYIQHELERGISKRTLQNKMVAIRAALLGFDRDRLVADQRLTNHSLGLTEARSLKIKPITHAEFEGAIRSLREKDAYCEAAALGLIYYFGLSATEALESCPYLQDWKANIERGDPFIEVIYGKRPRKIKIFDYQSALKAVNDAKNANRKGPFLVNGVGKTAVSALYRLNNQLTTVLRPLGLCTYSVRYAYLQFQVDFYRSEGICKKEATQRASAEMGLADQEYRSAKKVYNFKS